MPYGSRDARHPDVRVFSRVPILILAVCQVAATQTPKLKSVELDNKYTIQVPEYFTMHRISKSITRVPAYYFQAARPHFTTIHVELLPYDFVVSADAITGLLELPAAIGNSPPLTGYFQPQQNRYAYFGWSVIDRRYECTMNSPCPHSTPFGSRYMAEYAFAVFDKPDHSVVEFTAMQMGPSKKVTGFQGDGKLLRDVIVPSLTSIH
jgi:hypothetical protein